MTIHEYFKLINFNSPILKYQSACNSNEQKLSEKYRSSLNLTAEIFDASYFLSMKYIAILEHLHLIKNEESFELFITAFHKNMITLYSSLLLTKEGLFGSARIMFRHIFEFLIIAKYVSLSGDNNLLDKWYSSENISLKTDVFKKITHPNSQEIKNWWALLCGYAHSTIQSQQLSILIEEENENDIKFNFISLWMLMEMNYHLLNTHIANSRLKYHLKAYLSQSHYEEVCKIKDYIKSGFKKASSMQGKSAKAVIKDYKQTWILKK